MSTKKDNTPDVVVSSTITDDMFATDDVIEHAVTLGDGVERTLYFRELSAMEFKQHLEAENSKDNKVRKESTARLISRCLVEPDGRRALTPVRAAKLKPSVSGAIFMAILRVSGVLPAAVKPDNDDEHDGDEDFDEASDDDDGDSQGEAGKGRRRAGSGTS